MIKFWQKLSSKFLLLGILILPTFSCDSSPKIKPNAVFEKKYGAEVEKITSQKIEPTEEEEKIPVVMYPPTKEEVNQANIAANPNYYPYTEVIRFNQPATSSFLVGQETYQQIIPANPNSLPENMFETSYNTALYPPFRKFGFEFDQIRIPPRDVYGVSTELAEKPYLLAGNKALQKSVDQIIREKTVDDVEISETLIKEQKQLKRRQKMIRIFGSEDEFEATAVEVKKEQPKQEKIVMQQNLDTKNKSKNFSQKIFNN